MEEMYVLWMKGKRGRYKEKIPMKVNNWFVADFGSYDDMVRELISLIKMGGSASYYKITQEKDVDWMGWYK